MKKYISTFLFAIITLELFGQSGWSRAKEVDISARSESSPAKDVGISQTPKPTAPANLEISDVTFSDKYGNHNSILDANEEAEIEFTLSNLGKGSAHALAADVRNLMSGVELLFKKHLGDLFAGQSKRVSLPIRGVPLLETGKAELVIHVEEANGFDSDTIKLVFHTQGAKIPEVSIADYAFASDDGEAIALGQPITLTLMLQNKGQGEAIDIRTDFKTPDNVFPAAESSFHIDQLKPNETRSIVYEFFGNKKYDGREIPIEVSITDGHGAFEQIHTLRVPVVESSSQTQTVNIAARIDQPVTIQNISLRSDVDVNIPSTGKVVKNRFALIIGNEDYGKFQTGLQSDQNVLFARNDALVFKEYAIKTLGVLERHTFLLTDATRGQMSREIERITELAKLTPDAEIVFYYAGHGLPDFETYQSYLIPVDVTASNLEDAINLRDMYAKLASSKANKIIVILDACFSGGGRGENGLLAARTVKIRPKSDIIEGNIVAFTATSGKEVSLPFESQSHGLFTYYLLRKLQETDGNVTLDELGQHLEGEIPKASLLENGLLQRPQVLVSPELDGKMDVMEILTKINFLCMTLIVSLCTSTGFAQDEQRVERVKGEWIISNDITPLEAREKAISQAKTEALRQAGISEYIAESDLMFKTESNNKLRDIHESWTSIEVSGEISQFQVVDERKAINEFGNLSYEVWINATVIRHQTSKDAGLYVGVDGIHESYRSPDELIFEIMPSKEGFLNIFILGEDESLHLYPNKFEKRERFEGGKLYKFPRSTALDYEVSSEDSIEVNYLILLYTKVEIPFLEEETPENILRFIAKIDPSQKWLKSYSILIRQK